MSRPENTAPTHFRQVPDLIEIICSFLQEPTYKNFLSLRQVNKKFYSAVSNGEDFKQHLNYCKTLNSILTAMLMHKDNNRYRSPEFQFNVSIYWNLLSVYDYPQKYSDRAEFEFNLECRTIHNLKKNTLFVASLKTLLDNLNALSTRAAKNNASARYGKKYLSYYALVITNIAYLCFALSTILFLTIAGGDSAASRNCFNAFLYSILPFCAISTALFVVSGKNGNDFKQELPPGPLWGNDTKITKEESVPEIWRLVLSPAAFFALTKQDPAIPKNTTAVVIPAQSNVRSEGDEFTPLLIRN